MTFALVTKPAAAMPLLVTAHLLLLMLPLPPFASCRKVAKFCTTNENCTATVKESVCYQNRCQCKVFFENHNNACTPLPQCNADKDCFYDDGLVGMGKCDVGSKKCVCDPMVAEMSSDGAACQNLLYLRGCYNDAQCASWMPGTRCDDSMCQCPFGQYPNSTVNKCLPLFNGERCQKFTSPTGKEYDPCRRAPVTYNYLMKCATNNGSCVCDPSRGGRMNPLNTSCINYDPNYHFEPPTTAPETLLGMPLVVAAIVLALMLVILLVVVGFLMYSIYTMAREGENDDGSSNQEGGEVSPNNTAAKMALNGGGKASAAANSNEIIAPPSWQDNDAATCSATKVATSKSGSKTNVKKTIPKSGSKTMASLSQPVTSAGKIQAASN